MSEHELHVDVTRSLLEDGTNGHNRLHPEIPAVLEVAPGDTVTLDLRDGFDCQIAPGSSCADVLRLDPWRGHPMTGPIAVEGTEPGDVLDVRILAVEPAGFGFTAVIPSVGALGDAFDRPFLVVWDLADGEATSRDMPGVVIPGRPFVGVIAVAPSRALLERATERESAIAGEGRFVLLPDERSAVPPGGVPAREGLRTLPPRENGGNLDLRHARAGSTVSLPVHVPGALCSLGDPHFAQGDGESAGVAIETSARVTVCFGVRKPSNGAPEMPLVHFVDEPVSGRREFVATTGIPVDADGRNGYLDVRTAAQAALRGMLRYLTQERGLTDEQAYVLASVACDLQISEIVNAPNALVSAVLPLDVFADQGRT